MAPEKTKPERMVWGVLLVGMTILMAFAFYTFFKPTPEPLPQLAQTPVFALTDQTGESYSSTILEGNVWMASFIFTGCRGICPLIITGQKSVHDRLDQSKPWTMVSFSVDPENDTPEVLAAYAETHGAASPHWSFLTGEKQELRELIIKGFMLAVEDDSGSEEEPILHSQRIALIDATGSIRGYYDSLDPLEMDRLLKNANQLLQEIP